jgi:hypothetical protein
MGLVSPLCRKTNTTVINLRVLARFSSFASVAVKGRDKIVHN